MDTEKIKTLEAVSDALTSTETTIEFTVAPQHKLQRWLQKKGWLPSKKKYQMRPITLGNLIRISRLLLTINPDVEQLKKGKFLDISYHAVMNHSETIVKICAIAIKNAKADPGAALQSELRHNLTAKELMTILMIVLQQMDISAFMQSIILIRGLNVLESGEKKNEPNEVSPTIQER